MSTLLLLAGGLAALYGLLRRTSLPAWPAAVREVLHSFWKVVALVPYRSARCATRYLQVRQRQAPQSADTEPFPAPAVASPTR